MTIQKIDDNNYGFRDSTGLSCVLTESDMWEIHNYMHKLSFIETAENLFDLTHEQDVYVGSEAYDIWLDMDLGENDPENEALQKAYDNFKEGNI